MTAPLTIAEGPNWGHIEGPGFGVTVDEEKLMAYHEAYRSQGEFLPYGARPGQAG